MKPGSRWNTGSAARRSRENRRCRGTREASSAPTDGRTGQRNPLASDGAPSLPGAAVRPACGFRPQSAACARGVAHIPISFSPAVATVSQLFLLFLAPFHGSQSWATTATSSPMISHQSSVISRLSRELANSEGSRKGCRGHVPIGPCAKPAIANVSTTSQIVSEQQH